MPVQRPYGTLLLIGLMLIAWLAYAPRLASYTKTSVKEMRDSLMQYRDNKSIGAYAGQTISNILSEQIPGALPEAVATKQVKSYCTLIEEACTDTKTTTAQGKSIWNSMDQESQIAIHAACTGKGVGQPAVRQYWANDHVDPKMINATQKLSSDKKTALRTAQTNTACSMLGKKGRFLEVGDTDDIIAAIGCAACKPNLRSSDPRACEKLCGSTCSTPLLKP